MLSLFLLAFFCLNVYSCLNIRSKQNYDAIDNKIQEFEELLIRYSFYKSYIIDNNLPINNYYEILFSYIEKMQKIADYLYTQINENFDNYHLAKLNLLVDILLKESSELENLLKK